MALDQQISGYLLNARADGNFRVHLDHNIKNAKAAYFAREILAPLQPL